MQDNNGSEPSLSAARINLISSYEMKDDGTFSRENMSKHTATPTDQPPASGNQPIRDSYRYKKPDEDDWEEA